MDHPLGGLRGGAGNDPHPGLPPGEEGAIISLFSVSYLLTWIVLSNLKLMRIYIVCANLSP